MIRWCMYCQRFLGERAPYDNPAFSHGLCDACDARSESGKPVHAETSAARLLMNQLYARASVGDEQACLPLIAQARAAGLDVASICIGLLQPALYQAGLNWQEGRMSVLEEHRFTSWCERVLAMLESAPVPTGPLDLVIFTLPSNEHHLGPKVAARVLSARGFRVEAIVPGLPFDEILAHIEKTRPTVVGFSCSLATHVPEACQLIAQLRAKWGPGKSQRFMLGGFAFRSSHPSAKPSIDADIETLVDLETFRP